MRLPLLLKRPVPSWVLLLVILVAASVITEVVIIPRLSTQASDFSLSADPVTHVGVENFPGTTTIHIISTRNFTGVVTLNLLPPPNVTAFFGLTQCPQGGCTTLTALLGRKADLNVNVFASFPGNYTLGVTADSGSISHSLKLPVDAQQLKIQFQPANLNITQGETVSAVATLTSYNGISGNITLFGLLSGECTRQFDFPCPKEIGANPQNFLLSPNTSKTVNVTFSAPPFAGGGSYDFTFAASLCCNPGWTVDYVVTIVYASENITLTTYQFYSSTNVTLSLRNNGPLNDQVQSYQVNDTLGHTYSWNYCSLSCDGPILLSNTTALISFPITYAPSFMFTRGQMYTIAFRTTRNNPFLFGLTY